MDFIVEHANSGSKFKIQAKDPLDAALAWAKGLTLRWWIEHGPMLDLLVHKDGKTTEISINVRIGLDAALSEGEGDR